MSNEKPSSLLSRLWAAAGCLFGCAVMVWVRDATHPGRVDPVGDHPHRDRRPRDRRRDLAPTPLVNAKPDRRSGGRHGA